MQKTLRWKFTEFHNFNVHEGSGLERDRFQESITTADSGVNNLPIRVIDVETKKLVNVTTLIWAHPDQNFSYAALSHTWGFEEVIYSDLHSGVTLDKLDHKKEGQEKLRGSVRAAKELGLKYIWSDTCCIDKANYTELAESIASMGQWYTNSDVCVVYLADIHSQSLADVPEYADNPNHPNGYDGTRWSNRGWTLQEIVLCPKAVFYNASWTKMDSNGSGSDKDISRICSLPRDTACLGCPPLRAASEILSWAAVRRTTKSEDGAYSLMGILGTIISIAYGEGLERALSRLIEAVVREKGDITVFNWTGKDYGRSMYPSCLLAYHNPGVVSSERTLNPVSISNMGVCSLFDVIPVTLEWGIGRTDDSHFNTGSHKAKSDIEKTTLNSVTTLMDPKRFNASSHDECIATGKLQIPNHSPIEDVKLVCPLWMLMAYAQYRDLRECIDVKDPDTLHKGWVVAKFSNTPNADWFLYQFLVMGRSFYVGLRIPTDSCFKLEQTDIPTRSLVVQMHMVT